MPSIGRFLGLVPAVLLAGALEAAAASFQFDNVIYEWPENGRRVTRPDSVLLSPDRDSDFAIEIFRSARRPPNVEAWLTSRMAELLGDDAQPEGDFPIQRLRQGEVSMVLAGQAVDGNPQMFFAILIGDRVELVRLDYRGDIVDMEAVVAKYVLPLVSSLRLVSAGAAPLLGPPTPGPLDGIYYAQGVGYGFAGLELAHHFLMLSGDGYFFEGLPEGIGTAGLDYGPVLAAQPDDAGTYRVDGDAIRFSYADGAVQELSFTPGADRLGIGSREYRITVPAEDGLLLEGRYSRGSYTQFSPGSGTVGGVYSGSRYMFGRDGQFTSDRYGGAFGNFETGTGDLRGGFATGAGPDVVAGTYRVEGGALVLTDSAGETVRHSLAIVVDGMIAIDGAIYLRDDD